MEDGNYSRRYFSSCYKKLDYEYLGFACLKKKKFSLSLAPTILDKNLETRRKTLLPFVSPVPFAMLS